MTVKLNQMIHAPCFHFFSRNLSGDTPRLDFAAILKSFRRELLSRSKEINKYVESIERSPDFGPNLHKSHWDIGYEVWHNFGGRRGRCKLCLARRWSIRKLAKIFPGLLVVGAWIDTFWGCFRAVSGKWFFWWLKHVLISCTVCDYVLFGLSQAKKGCLTLLFNGMHRNNGNKKIEKVHECIRKFGRIWTMNLRSEIAFF